MIQIFKVGRRTLQQGEKKLAHRSQLFRPWVLLQVVLCLGLASAGCQSPPSEAVQDMAMSGTDGGKVAGCGDVKCANPDNICCSASDPCVDVKTNPRHCGGCEKSCPFNAVCASGVCVCRTSGHDELCPLDALCCDDGCYQVRSDSNNCGACGLKCNMGESCVEGQCKCGPTGLSCGSDQTCCSSGCSDLQGDPNNCGACGHRCKPGKHCYVGVCEGDCAVPCTPDVQACCDGTCKGILFDKANCGGCGIKCTGFFNFCSLGKCTDKADMGAPADLRAQPDMAHVLSSASSQK